MSRSAFRVAPPAAKAASQAQGILQRKCACGNHTVAGGMCEDCAKPHNLLHSAAHGESAADTDFPPRPVPIIQTKLTIGAADNPLEAEADRVAEHVLAVPSHSHVNGTSPRIQHLSCQSTGEADTVPASVDRVLAGPGRSLDPALRRDMEQRFGHDFSKVRVHSGALAEQSAREVSANAYTVGHNIVFGAGRFAPGTHDGQRLLAHELTHVVQQRIGASAGNVPGMIQRQPSSPVTGESEGREDSILRAAERARSHPNDRTQMLSSASEIVYRLIALFLPDYKGRISWVNYEEQIKGVRVASSGAYLSITVGKQFVLSTTRATLERSALDLGAAIFAKAPRDKPKRKGLLSTMYADQQSAPGAVVSFDEALKEGAQVLHAAGFGLVCGRQSGQDTEDRYDARDWKEKEGRREVLVSRIEPWLAFTRLINNLGKDVPKATSGTTRWAFDCFGFVIINRVYAYWRTLTRREFNSRFTTLELGINSNVNQEWEKAITSDRPGDKPSIVGEAKESSTGGVFELEKTPVHQTWNELLDTAPIGTQVTWGNQDAKTKCTAKPELSFCAFMFENTTKVGKNQYSAHPFGIVTREFIEDEMAKAVLNAEGKPVTEGAKKAYIKKFVYISGIRFPKKPPSMGINT